MHLPRLLFTTIGTLAGFVAAQGRGRVTYYVRLRSISFTHLTLTEILQDQSVGTGSCGWTPPYWNGHLGTALSIANWDSKAHCGYASSTPFQETLLARLLLANSSRFPHS